MRCPWVARVAPVGCPWSLLVCPKVACRVYVRHSWVNHGVLRGSSRGCVAGSAMGCLWIARGSLVGCPWALCPMGCPWRFIKRQCRSPSPFSIVRVCCFGLGLGKLVVGQTTMRDDAISSPRNHHPLPVTGHHFPLGSRVENSIDAWGSIVSGETN